MSRVVIAALYHFARVPDPAALKGPLLDVAAAGSVRGSLLLASEGINGTIAGKRAGIDAVLAHIRGVPGFANLEHKESFASEQPFNRLKVRLKKEIVTLGVDGVDPTAAVGHYVDPCDWNDLISRDDVVVIDTRNAYETAIGGFQGMVDPGTKSFREFPAWWAENADKFHNKRVAMYCTGGIRCEKSTNFLISQGVEDVYHLKGGILKYLEDVPQSESMWDGECYVFDHRVSVGHGLTPGDYIPCYACGRPVSPEDRASSDYEDGVSCPGCIDEYTEERRERFRERQRQVNLARERGARHVGE